MSIRQQLINCLEFAKDIEELGAEVAQWQQQIVLMQSEENRLDDRIGFFRKICLIALGFAVLFIGVGIGMYGFGDTLRLLRSMLSFWDDPTGVLTWLVIAVIVGGGLVWVLSARKLRRLQAENCVKQQQIETEILQLQEQIRKLAVYGQEEGYFDIVPMDYFGTEMLEYCISVIDRKLATTLQEVFLLLERELQRQEQMMQQQMWYEAQAEQMEQLTNAVHRNTIVTMLAEQERHNNYH